jgi:hypothetical protein
MVILLAIAAALRGEQMLDAAPHEMLNGVMLSSSKHVACEARCPSASRTPRRALR